MTSLPSPDNYESVAPLVHSAPYCIQDLCRGCLAPTREKGSFHVFWCFESVFGNWFNRHSLDASFALSICNQDQSWCIYPRGYVSCNCCWCVLATSLLEVEALLFSPGPSMKACQRNTYWQMKLCWQVKDMRAVTTSFMEHQHLRSNCNARQYPRLAVWELSFEMIMDTNLACSLCPHNTFNLTTSRWQWTAHAARQW